MAKASKTTRSCMWDQRLKLTNVYTRHQLDEGVYCRRSACGFWQRCVWITKRYDRSPSFFKSVKMTGQVLQMFLLKHVVNDRNYSANTTRLSVCCCNGLHSSGFSPSISEVQHWSRRNLWIFFTIFSGDQEWLSGELGRFQFFFCS